MVQAHHELQPACSTSELDANQMELVISGQSESVYSMTWDQQVSNAVSYTLMQEDHSMLVGRESLAGPYVDERSCVVESCMGRSHVKCKKAVNALSSGKDDEQSPCVVRCMPWYIAELQGPS